MNRTARNDAAAVVLDGLGNRMLVYSGVAFVIALAYAM